MPWGVVSTDTQTFWLLRRMRAHLRDEERTLYPDDNLFVQTLLDVFPAFLVRSGQPVLALDDAEEEDPLATDSVQTATLQEVWSLLGAVTLLEGELLEAGRLAAVITSPTGRMDLQQVAGNLERSLVRLEDRLELLVTGMAGPLFIDLTLMDEYRASAELGAA
jgi:hypothetical protein